MTTRKLVSLAIPAYNEASNLRELVDRLGTVFEDLSDRYEFEIVVCENGSHDNSFELLKELREIEPRLKIIRLTRNFNMEGGMMEIGRAHV